MNQGLWVWPSDPKGQRRTIRRISESEHLVAALKAIAKSKEGLSNAELDDIISDNSNWMTLWVVRQLTSLGLVDYRVDYFGNPARYALTDLGKDTLQRITGQPVVPNPSTQAAPSSQTSAAMSPPSTPAIPPTKP